MGEPLAHQEIQEEGHEPITVRDEASVYGKHRLCFELASGGMATVYLARTEGPAGYERLVALKRIHPHLAKDRAFVDMFLDEARIASRINHPNVCHVFDFGESNDTYYIAMEYLVGEPLSKVIRTVAKDKARRHDPANASYAARIVADACEGLHAAHELRDPKGELLDVVHRDISPQNLFVTYDGGVRVVDFGIASARDRLHHTATGQVKGKFAYMAPEQARAKTVDRRADVWALGVVLWEMLTMKRLFRRETQAETILAVAEGKVPPPSAIRPTVPKAIDAVVLKALARDPEERYKNAREFGRDLVNFIRKSDHPVAMPEMSEFMEGLFPEGLAKKRQLVDIARQREIIPVVDTREESSVSRVISMESTITPTGVSEPESSKLPLIIGTVLLSALFIGGGALLAAYIAGSDEASSTGTATSLPIGTDLANTNPAPPPEPTPEPPAEPVVEPEVEPVGEVVELDDPNAETGATADPDGETEPESPTGDTPPEDSETEPGARTSQMSAQRATQMTKRGGSSMRRVTMDAPEEPPSAMMDAPPMMEAPVPTGRGGVRVITPGGWAAVYHRGRLLGQTPREFQLPAGSQTLQIQMFGEGPRVSRRVTVEANSTTRLVVRQ